MEKHFILFLFIAISIVACNNKPNPQEINESLTYKLFSLDTVYVDSNHQFIPEKSHSCKEATFVEDGEIFNVAIHTGNDSLIIYNDDIIDKYELPDMPFIPIVSIAAINRDSIFLLADNGIVSYELSNEKDVHDIYLVNCEQEVLATYDFPQTHLRSTDSLKITYSLGSLHYSKNMSNKLFVSCLYSDDNKEDRENDFPLVYTINLQTSDIEELNIYYTNDLYADTYSELGQKIDSYYTLIKILHNNRLRYSFSNTPEVYIYDMANGKSELLARDTVVFTEVVENKYFSKLAKIEGSDYYFMKVSVKETCLYAYFTYYKVYDNNFNLIGAIDATKIKIDEHSKFFLVNDFKTYYDYYLNFNKDKYEELSREEIQKRLTDDYMIEQ